MGLDTCDAILPIVKRDLGVLHARTFCHATEDIVKVRTAMANAFGACELHVQETEGHHGNPISILECSMQDADGVLEFFSKIGDDDLQQLLRTLDERVDDGCHLFLKIDKQSAYQGDIRLSSGEDVLSVRVKVRSYPAKRELAVEAASEYLLGVLERRKASS